MPVCAYTTSSFYQIKPCLSTFSEKVCIKRTIRQQFGRAAPDFRFRQQSIHLREKNIAGPPERSAMHMHCLARREGTAFFDEDDVCAGY